MIAYIVILWVIIKLNAPLWCYVLTVMGIVVRAIDFVLRTIDRALERRLKALKETEDDLDSMR